MVELERGQTRRTFRSEIGKNDGILALGSLEFAQVAGWIAMVLSCVFALPYSAFNFGVDSSCLSPLRYPYLCCMKPDGTTLCRFVCRLLLLVLPRQALSSGLFIIQYGQRGNEKEGFDDGRD